MMEFLNSLLFRLVGASASLVVAWLCATLLLRSLKRPSARLQAWLSWIPLWHAILIGTFTIPLAVLPQAHSTSSIVEPQYPVMEASGTVDVADSPASFSTPAVQNDIQVASFGPKEPAPLIRVESLRVWACSLAAIIWLMGCLVIICAWLVRYVQFVRYTQTCVDASADSVQLWRKLLENCHASCACRVMESDHIGPAITYLPRRYVLLLPAGLWHNLDQQAREVVMRHELSHLRRGHLWKLMLARFLATIHWFNPCAWSSVSRLASAYECMADEDAVGDDMSSACKLAAALLEFCPKLPASSTALAARGFDLKNRISRLIDDSVPQESMRLRCTIYVVACLLTVCSSLRIELVNAQEQADAQPGLQLQNNINDVPFRKDLPPRNTFDFRLLGAATPPVYELAPGDRIGITYEKEGIDREIILPANGTVDLTGVGKTKLAGLSVEKARQQLSTLTAPHPIALRLLESREVSVVVTRELNMVGDKRQPSEFVSQICHLPAYQNDVLHALHATQGTPTHAFWRIYLIHRPMGDRLRIVTIDCRDRQVDPRDIVLNEGDEVIVQNTAHRRAESVVDLRGIGNFLLVVANGSWSGAGRDGTVPLINGSFPITELLKLQARTDISKLPFKSALQFTFLSGGKLTYSKRYFEEHGELLFDFTLHPQMLLPSLEKMAEEMGVASIYSQFVEALKSDRDGPKIDLANICSTLLDNHCQLIVENRTPILDRPQEFAVVVRTRGQIEEVLAKLANTQPPEIKAERIGSTDLYSTGSVSFCAHDDRLIVGSHQLVKQLAK